MNNSVPFVYPDEAAKLANVSRRTIDRDIKDGKISGTQIRKEGGRKKIAVAELERVYGQLGQTNQPSPKTKASQRPTVSKPNQTENEVIKLLKEELERERERTRKAEDASERWETRFIETQERLNGLLLPAPQSKKRGFMARLFGKKEV
jgi:excisionase family DNA binding protein